MNDGLEIRSFETFLVSVRNDVARTLAFCTNGGIFEKSTVLCFNIHTWGIRKYYRRTRSVKETVKVCKSTHHTYCIYIYTFIYCRSDAQGWFSSREYTTPHKTWHCNIIRVISKSSTTGNNGKNCIQCRNEYEEDRIPKRQYCIIIFINNNILLLTIIVSK